MSMAGRQTLVDEDFEVPKGLLKEKFRLRMMQLCPAWNILKKPIAPFGVQIGLRA